MATHRPKRPQPWVLKEKTKDCTRVGVAYAVFFLGGGTNDYARQTSTQTNPTFGFSILNSSIHVKVKKHQQVRPVFLLASRSQNGKTSSEKFVELADFLEIEMLFFGEKK